MPRESSSGQVSQWGVNIHDGDSPRIAPSSNRLYVPVYSGSTFSLSTTLVGVIGFTLTSSAILNQIRIHVTTGSAGNATIVLYGSNKNNEPGTLITSGTVDVTTTGKKALSLTQPLVAGTYYVGAMASSATATVYGQAASTSGPELNGTVRNVGGWDNLRRSGVYYYTAASAGTPDTSPTWSFDTFVAGVVTYDVRFA